MDTILNRAETSLAKVLAKATLLVTPKENEARALSATASKVLGNLERCLREAAVKPEVRLGGSYAKGTWLPSSADIDFFLLYPPDYPREKLETEAISISKQAVARYKTKLRFAEHPYLEAFVGRARVNLVPCYKVERGEWKSAADRSPFHTEYIEHHFDDKLKTETRLLKKFVKGAGVYGAEVKVHGFSGYVCEVLILKFGNFPNVLKELSSIKQPGQVISTESYDKDFVSSFTSPLIILDPVDSHRNLGSAISMENVAKLILQCRKFLARPSLNFFFEDAKRKPSVGKRTPNRELLQRTLVISFKTDPRSVDILWGQLYRSLESLARQMKLWGFEILRMRASSNEMNRVSAFLFLFLETEISKYNLRSGPEVFRAEDLSKYMQKNEKRALAFWLNSEGRVESLFERERGTNDIFKLVRKTLGDPKMLDSLGLSKAIREELRRSFAVHEGLSVFRNRSKENVWLRKDLIELVSEDEVLRNATTATPA